MSKKEVIMGNETKAELKRQAVAKKLHPQLIKTADLLHDYYDAHCTLMRENGDSLKIRGSDDVRLIMARDLEKFASLLG